MHLDIIECFKLAMLNKWTFKAYYEFCKGLPTILKELSQHVNDKVHIGKDGLYPFKRELIVDKKV